MISFSAVRLRGATRTFLCSSLCSVVCSWPYPTTSAAKAVIPLSSGRDFFSHIWRCCSSLCIFHRCFFFFFDLLKSGHWSNLSYSLSWRTEHQKSPLWRSRTLCQRSCTTLWYKSRLSYLLNVYFYVTMSLIMVFFSLWPHCRKKSFTQTWSCVLSWL